MPTRHGLNNTARGFFTKHEIEKMGYGTQKRRLGADSQLAFGDCALSLAPAIDPVASPSGTIYSREAIVKYLLAKTKELKRAKAAYKRELAEIQKQEDEQTHKRVRKAADDFVARENGAALAPARDDVFARDMEKIRAVERQKLVNKLAESVDSATKEEKQAEIKKSAFWLPQHAPGHKQVKLKKPPKRPLSPFSGKPLKLSELVSIEIPRTDAGKPVCAVSQKEINFNQAVAIATSGKVMLKQYFDEIAAASHVCPITGKKFESKDVIFLRKAASGKAASGTVVAEHWTPGMK